jgi:hypothetical protein
MQSGINGYILNRSFLTVDTVDETDEICRKYMDEFINYEDNNICMDVVSGGTNTVPLEWILGWCSKDRDSYIIAREMMWERYSSLNMKERRIYRRGLVAFYRMMCESIGIKTAVSYIKLVEDGVVSEISYRGE